MDQIIGKISLSELILFLTFIGIVWYSWESRQLRKWQRLQALLSIFFEQTKDWDNGMKLRTKYPLKLREIVETHKYDPKWAYSKNWHQSVTGNFPFINYMKKFKPVILVSIISAIACVVIGTLIFEGSLPFLPYLLLSGFFMALVQKETKAYIFLDKLLIGSLLFGILTMFLVSLRMYITTRLFGDSSFPFFFWLQKDSLMMALLFSFNSFLGGLLGIVAKGFYVLYKKQV